MTPDGKIKAIPREIGYQRVERCRMMLYLHDFLTEAENKRVMTRISKWALNHANSQGKSR